MDWANRLHVRVSRGIPKSVILSLLLFLVACLFIKGQLPHLARNLLPFPGLQSAQTVVPPDLNNWIPIPEWLAGTWQGDSEILLDYYDYNQGRSTLEAPTKVNISRQSTIGMQRDRQGQIWYCASTPYEKTIESDSFIEYQKMERIVPVRSATNEVTVTCLATIQRLTKDTKELQDIYREQTTTTYSPLSNGLIQVSFNITDYDVQGHPISASKAFCTEKRIKDFEVVDQDQRGDLRHQFNDFLIANGMSYDALND